MKNLLKISAIITCITTNVFANDVVDKEIKRLQKDWAIAKYKSDDDDQKIDGYRKCVSSADELLVKFQDSPKSCVLYQSSWHFFSPK